MEKADVNDFQISMGFTQNRNEVIKKQCLNMEKDTYLIESGSAIAVNRLKSSNINEEREKSR